MKMTNQMNNKPKKNILGNNKKPNGPGGPGGPKFKRGMNTHSWIVFVLLSIMLFMMVNNFTESKTEITWSEFLRRIKSDQVAKLEVTGTIFTGTMHAEAMEGKGKESDNFKVIGPEGVLDEEWFTTLLDIHKVEWECKEPSLLTQILLTFAPWIVLLLVMYFFVFRQLRGAGGGGMLGNFGRSKHRLTSKDQSNVTFEDVAGIDEAKDEVQEVIQFLRSPKKFQRLGGRIPRGILLVGEPGCGKTLLAKAIAGEAEVPFFSISGSDFVEMFVGVGASRVRDLFKQAKDNSPCIIFLDEIDAVGRKRGSGFAGGGHDEREQTLNAILVEMDGFATNDQVIVIAATNRGDVLDHALTRPGRFDRQIYVPLPDIKGRMEILRVHAKKVKMSDDVDLHRLGRGTPMFSGADLEAIINEAALAATMTDKESVEMTDLEEARDKVRWGRARRSRVIDEKDKAITAYHESGHALAQSLLEHADPVHKVSIIPRGNMGGATFSLPEKDRTLYTRNFCLAQIQVALGGRVAEEIFCGDISSGASSDIKMATEIAKSMVMNWGMSDKLGFVHYGGEAERSVFAELYGGREYSDHTAEAIDSEIKGIVDKAYLDTKQLIEKHRPQMEMLKDALMKYETLDDEEIKQIISGKKLDKPTVVDLLEAEQKRSEEQAKSAESSSDKPDIASDGFSADGPMPEPA